MKLIFILLFIGFFTTGIFAQPCKDNWQFRVPVTVDNSTNPHGLENFQVRIVLNTNKLIQNNYLLEDAGDLRFTNFQGEELPFWIEEYTLNTKNTIIWVKVDEIPANSNVDIFLFYGNENALSVMDGDETFQQFDDFNGDALDMGKWNYCGGLDDNKPELSRGSISFSSSEDTHSHSITSLETFTSPVVTSMFVRRVENGISVLGHMNPSNKGFGMALEGQNGIFSFRMVKLVNPESVSYCQSLENSEPPEIVASGKFTGTWSFIWPEEETQVFIWPDGQETRYQLLDSISDVSEKKVVIGNFQKTGKLSVDYVYTRKYSEIEPGFSIGEAVEIIKSIEISSNSPVCKGQTIELFASQHSNAVYSWYGPNGYTSSEQNPVIENSDYYHKGRFILDVSIPESCSALKDTLWVEMDSITEAGGLHADAVFCSGTEKGTLRVENTVGKIAYWESSSSKSGPWNTISSTADSLVYDNLLASTFFRVIAENGTCGMDVSNMVEVRIVQPAKGGFLTSNVQDVCFGNNKGTVKANAYFGDIKNWQMSTDFGKTWKDLTSSEDEFTFKDLEDTTWYRIQVQNDICSETYSDTAIVNVHPLPRAEFSVDSVCLKNPNTFYNTSGISSGSIVGYSWSFDDGQGSSIRSPRHAYEFSGTYKTSLKVVSDMGCEGSTEANAVVHPLPIPDFTTTIICDSANASFTNISGISTGSITKNFWNYGDNSPVGLELNGSHQYDTFGNYEVTLVTESDKGCIDSVKKNQTILQRAKVSFETENVCLGDEMTFVNTSNSNSANTSYKWNFGDGNTSDKIQPQHTFSNAGTFNVTLQANSYSQCVNSKTGTITVYPIPKPGFTSENKCLYDSLSFLNTSTIESGSLSFEWDFGDLTRSTQKDLYHKYSDPGKYKVKLSASSDCGCKAETSSIIEVFPVPRAEFRLNDVCLGSTLVMNNHTDISSGELNFVWEMGDGSTSTDENPTHVFGEPGNYSVRLIVNSEKLCTDTVVKSVTIHPIPDASFEVDNVCLGNASKFMNTSSINEGEIVLYEWGISDGTQSGTKNLNHTFQAHGYYNAKLTVTSDKGCKSSFQKNVSVYPIPEVDFSFTNKCVFEEVEFTNLSTIENGLLSYNWKFGDGTDSQLESTSHVYPDHGFYPVQLKCATEYGCIDSLVKIVEIFPLPLVDAGQDTFVSLGYSTILQGISPSAVSISWSPALNIEDVSNLTTKVQPLQKTKYILEVTDENGCSSFDDIEVDVIPDYQLKVTNIVTPNGDGKNDTWKIYNASNYDDIQVHIFDRWGKEVFSADNYITEWGGIVNFDNLPDGTYYYLITFEQSDKVYKGSVTILR